MFLTPTERDRLLIFAAAELARARRARGLRLNVPETVALVADTVCEAARDGARHAEALAAGQAVLGPDDVLPGVADVVTEVKAEAVFEANPRLDFDRAAAYGRHLHVPAGSTVRFDPGAATTVELVPIRGARVVIGFSGLVDGPLDAPGARQAALDRARACGYRGAGA